MGVANATAQIRAIVQNPLQLEMVLSEGRFEEIPDVSAQRPALNSPVAARFRANHDRRGVHMTPGTIFISHRAEYGELVRQLKNIIQDTSGGKIQVLISEDIPRGDEWRAVLETQLTNSESLFLIYGAP